MKKGIKVLLHSTLFSLLLTVIGGCSAATEGLLVERGTSDEPVVTIPYIPWHEPHYSIPVEEPVLSGESSGLLRGEFVTFYTWQSNGNFVTKVEVLEGFDELVPPWDYQMLTLGEFRILYGPDIQLWATIPWEGLIIYDPYQLVIDELNVSPELASLITPGMTKNEFFELMKNYNRSVGSDQRILTGDLKRSAARIYSYEPPTYNIEMDICDWVVLAGDVWWLKLFDLYYSHAALVGYCGDGQTAYNGPKIYEWVGGHPDFRGPNGTNPDGVIDLWDATVYEAIGPFYPLAEQVGHYFYSRAFIDPGRAGIKEISFNYSPAVWDDPNWLAIFTGVWNYAWSQNNCRWDFPQNKWNFGTPAWLGKKHTYCSLLVWQSYMYSTYYNAYNLETYKLDIDWDQGGHVYPGDLINSPNGRNCVEWNYWLR